MKLFWPALILAPALWSQSVPLYKNPDAPLEKRVEDLLSRMTLEEKVSQMMNDSSAIPKGVSAPLERTQKCPGFFRISGILVLLRESAKSPRRWAGMESHP